MGEVRHLRVVEGGGGRPEVELHDNSEDNVAEILEARFPGLTKNPEALRVFDIPNLDLVAVRDADTEGILMVYTFGSGGTDMRNLFIKETAQDEWEYVDHELVD